MQHRHFFLSGKAQEKYYDRVLKEVIICRLSFFYFFL